VTQELQTLHVELARRPAAESAAGDGLSQLAEGDGGATPAASSPPDAPAGGAGDHPHLVTPAPGGPRSGAQEPLGQNPPLHARPITRPPPPWGCQLGLPESPNCKPPPGPPSPSDFLHPPTCDLLNHFSPKGLGRNRPAGLARPATRYTVCFLPTR
jgi:hypothetical protein